MSTVIERPFSPRRQHKAAWYSIYAPADKQLIFTIIFLVLHAVAGLLMHRFRILAMVHAWITAIGGIGLVVRSRRLNTAAYVGAYIIGADVLWRMTESQFFWEGAKYLVSIIFIIALLKRQLFKGFTLPFIYFLLLIPSAALTISEMGLEEARGMISFNLSGPFLLAVSAWYFSNVKFSREQLLRLFLMLMGPVVAIAFIGLFATLTAAELHFTTESNFETSGGFGPNQVSTILGLASLLALFYILLASKGIAIKIAIFAALVLFAIQSAMTFSRGGLYAAGGAAGAGFFYLLREKRVRLKILLITGILLVVGNYLILPQLDRFTEGNLSARFKETDSSGRDLIIMSDLEIWGDNFTLGVGPGMSRAIHAQTLHSTMSHTEFTRLVAEHGIFGFMALLLLFILSLWNLMHAPTAATKAIVLSATVWSLLYMFTAAMRTAAPSFLFGLGFATFLLSENFRLTDRQFSSTKISTKRNKAPVRTATRYGESRDLSLQSNK